jgi:hypothetical protein
MEWSKANWIGHILHRNCLIKPCCWRKDKRKRRRERRHKQLFDDQRGKRRYLYLKEEAIDCNGWRTRFGKGYGPVARKTTQGRVHTNIGHTLLQKANTVTVMRAFIAKNVKIWFLGRYVTHVVCTMDPRTLELRPDWHTKNFGYDQKILALTYDQSFELRSACRSRPKRAVVNKDPICVHKLQSEPRYAFLWT